MEFAVAGVMGCCESYVSLMIDRGLIFLFDLVDVCFVFLMLFTVFWKQ
jgi:hypothetical protein